MLVPSTSRNRGLTRRSLLGAVPAAAALAAGLGKPMRAHAAGQLNIYSWPDYFSTDDLAAYAKKTGVTPNIATYDSNDTMFAKLNSPAGAGFDIVIPSSEWIKQLSEKGLLEEIDHSKLNLASLDQHLLNRDYDPGNKYSIPKDWGLLGVVYDPAAVGGEIETWDDFFKAGEKDGVSGKIRLSSSGWETIGPRLWLDGKNWNTATADDIRAAGEKLKPWAKNVKSFSGLDANSVANGAIVMAQCNQGKARACIGLNPKLKWAVPGPWSELWVDNYAIVKGAPDPDQAYDFLGFQLQPDVQLKETQYIGFPAPLAGLKDKLPADTKDADIIFGGANLDFSKLTSFVVNPDTVGVYTQVQSEIQAAAG
jgi:spermidine/putrescine transport system substrate-binding protein